MELPPVAPRMASRFLLACMMAVTTTASVQAGAKARQPNIIFIFTDDHASHAISAYGSRINKTPNIDRLAQEGMLFRHCLVTNAICGPSRACILTGKYSHKNGFYRNGNRFDGSQMTFPKILQNHGYQTALVGKWHLGTRPTGFDYWEVLKGQGPYYNPEMLNQNGSHRYTGYTTDIITDLTIQWLDQKRDRDRPFLLMYQHKAPHRNWQPGPKHLNLFDDVTIPEPDTLFDNHVKRASPSRNQKMTIAHHLSDFDLKLTAPRNLTPQQRQRWDAAYGPKNEAFRRQKLTGKALTRWQYQRYIKDYLRCVASVDDNIGRLLEFLTQTGLEDNTVVVYSSDQGWYLGDHGWYDKRWMYEESLTMPLIVRWPHIIQPGSVNSDMVSNVDFAETFLDIAGLKQAIPDSMQGNSFKPLLLGSTPKDWRDSFYYHYYEFPGPHQVAKHYGIRTSNYKLINYYRVGEWELFDLKNDPDEQINLYSQTQYASVVKDLKKKLDSLQQNLDEPHPEKPVPGDPETKNPSRK